MIPITQQGDEDCVLRVHILNNFRGSVTKIPLPWL